MSKAKKANKGAEMISNDLSALAGLTITMGTRGGPVDLPISEHTVNAVAFQCASLGYTITPLKSFKRNVKVIAPNGRIVATLYDRGSQCGMFINAAQGIDSATLLHIGALFNLDPETCKLAPVGAFQYDHCGKPILTFATPPALEILKGALDNLSTYTRTRQNKQPFEGQPIS